MQAASDTAWLYHTRASTVKHIFWPIRTFTRQLHQTSTPCNVRSLQLLLACHAVAQCAKKLQQLVHAWLQITVLQPMRASLTQLGPTAAFTTLHTLHVHTIYVLCTHGAYTKADYP
jgi:hypothetical protein